MQLVLKTENSLARMTHRNGLFVEIHQGFQRGLFRLRLMAARDLAESIQKLNLISNDLELPLKMSAQVRRAPRTNWVLFFSFVLFFSLINRYSVLGQHSKFVSVWTIWRQVWHKRRHSCASSFTTIIRSITSRVPISIYRILSPA